MFVPTEILREIRGVLIQALYVIEHNQFDHPDVIERIRQVREMLEELIEQGPRPAA